MFMKESKINNHECQICGKKFARTGQLKVHIDTVHGGIKNHHCKICDKKFGHSGHLNAHVKTVHEDENNSNTNSKFQKIYKCYRCIKSFTYMNSMKRHMSNFHSAVNQNILDDTEIERDSGTFYIENLNESKDIEDTQIVNKPQSDISFNKGQKEYKCKFCNYLSIHERNVQRHIRQRVCQKSNHCLTCKESFSGPQAYKEHIYRFHADLLDLHKFQYDSKCQTCDTYFHSIRYLKNHTDRVHKGKNDYKCSKCDWKSTKIDSLIEHNKKFHKDIKCDLCWKTFSANHDLKTHVDRAHMSIINEKYNCQSCKKLCMSKELLRRHIKKNHMDQNGGNMVCDLCGKSISDTENLLTHKYMEHSRSRLIQSKICETCGMSFSNTYKLKQHIIGVHGDIKPYKCDICSNRFNYSHGMKRHIKDFHENSQNISCDRCKKSFTTAKKLKLHMRKVHEGFSHPKKCELCGKKFATEVFKQRHIRLVHEGEKDYKCDSCGKFLSSPVSLKIHMSAIHEGKKDHICESCGHSFHLLPTLKRHINTVHEGQKVHKCVVCSKSFAQSWTLRRHVDTFHQSGAITNTQKDISEKASEDDSGNESIDTSKNITEKVSENDSMIVLGGPLENVVLMTSQETIASKMDPEKRVIDESSNSSIKNEQKEDKIMIQDGSKSYYYNCGSCGKSFKKAKKLQLHVRVFHEEHKNYKCTECGESFSQARKLSEHIGRCHETLKSESECDIDKNTKVKNDLNIDDILNEVKEKSPIKESISKITNQKSNNSIGVVSILKKRVKINIMDFSNCNCKNKGNYVSSHYCDDCDEGFCAFCVEAHQRFKVTRLHKIIKINYFCKCKPEEEKSMAAKYCAECSEFFCTDCIDAHQRLIVTRNHILKLI